MHCFMVPGVGLPTRGYAGRSSAFPEVTVLFLILPWPKLPKKITAQLAPALLHCLCPYRPELVICFPLMVK